MLEPSAAYNCEADTSNIFEDLDAVRRTCCRRQGAREGKVSLGMPSMVYKTSGSGCRISIR